MSQSEITQLRQHIEQETQAARQGLSGLAAGTARHDFITKRMERIHQASEQLIAHLGREQALPLIIAAMDGTI